MTPRKSHRVRKARAIWEQKGAHLAAKDPKITKIAARTAKKTALKPVATGPLPKTVEFDVNNLPRTKHRSICNLKLQNRLLRALRSFRRYKSF
jgi:hypothetical protein